MDEIGNWLSNVIRNAQTGQQTGQDAKANPEHDDQPPNFHVQDGTSVASSSHAPSISPSDIIIAVMGVTGSGKSTFISHLTEQAPVVGHDLESCTTDVTVHRAQIDGTPIFLVDTPGFNDTNRRDIDVLLDLASWLSTSYRHNIKLTGIVYLHPIHETRMYGSSMKNLRMFKRLCGEEGLGSVVLATSMWSKESNHQLANDRESQLKSKPEFWGDMIKQNATYLRHDNGKKSALKICRHLIKRRRNVALNIQREMVDQKKTLDMTAAGKEVQAEFEEARKKFEKRMDLLTREFVRAKKESDDKAAREIAELQAEAKKKDRERREEIRQLQVSSEQLERRFRYQTSQQPVTPQTKLIREIIYLCNLM